MRPRATVTVVVSVALVSVVTALLGVFGLYTDRSVRTIEMKHLRDGEQSVADQLTTALALPVWNFDHDQIDRIIEGAMRNEDIAAVVVSIHDRQSTVHAHDRDADWHPRRATAVVAEPDVLIESRSIVADGNIVGTLEVFATPRFVAFRLHHIRMLMIGSVLLLDVVLVLSIYFLLWRVVLGPLKRIELHATAVSAGERSGVTFDDNRFVGELERLRGSIASMIGQLDARFADVRAAEEKYRELVDGVRDVIFALTPDGVFTALNPAFEYITGFSREEWIGQSIPALLHPDDQASALADLGAVLRGNPSPGGRVYRVRTAAGTYRAGEIYMAPQRKDGRVVGVFGIGRDVTDRVTLEDQLRQAQKMEAVGRLAGGVAHDFNNLLTVISGRSKNLMERFDPTAPQRADVQEIERAATMAETLTRQLLAFSRRQILQPKVLALNDVVSGMETLLRRLVGEDVRLTTVLGPDTGRVRADAGQVEQVLMNLVVNARDAMPQGGALTIATRNVDLTTQLTQAHPSVTTARCVALSVSDSGTGIDADTRARIFEPFFTTKEPGKGTGLGLATVYGIVSQSGGFIDVASELGRGSTFTVYLPRVDDEAMATTPGAPRKPTQGTETILLVEDVAAVRSLMRETLERYKYQVIEAADPETAMVELAAHVGPVDLLVTDVVMPGMNGRELAERLRAGRADLRVLYVSGYAEDPDVRRGVVEPGSSYLQKPFTPSRFAQKVREVLDANGGA